MIERVNRASKHVQPAKDKLRRMGAPTKYDPTYMPKTAKFLAQRGAIQSEIAATFGVSTTTLQNWINQYPELHEAIQAGNDAFNPRVERALAERAIGFYQTVVEKHVTKDGDIIDVEYEKYFPPDVTAAIFFLKNRMRDKYRDVHNVDVNQRVQFKSLEEIDAQIRKDILDLQADGFLMDVTPPALATPGKKTHGR